MSIRKRISISFVLIVAFILPVVGMMLYYFEQMGRSMNTIIRTDARLIDVANSISENMIYAKSAESDFILLQDSLSVLQVQDAVKKILDVCAEAENMTRNKNIIFREIAGQTDRYQNAFTGLVEIYKEERIQDKFSTLHQAFSEKFRETMTSYNEMLAEARNEPDAARKETLINNANSYLRSFSIDDLAVDLNIKHEQQLRVISLNLSETSDKVLTLAGRLEAESWGSIEHHRQTGELLAARAQRNISVVLILTLFICIYIIVALPQRIVRPITALTNIVKRAEKGDYDVILQSGAKDEVGKLAQFLNRFLKQVRTHDRLKTEKISTQQKKFEALADAITEGVLVLNHEQEITLVNSTLQKQLGWQRNAVNMLLSACDRKGELNDLIREALRNNAHGQSKQLQLQDAEGKPLNFTARIYPLRHQDKSVSAIIVLLKAEG